MFEGVTTIFIFIIIPFKYALLTKREVVNMTGYMAKFLFLHFVRLSKSPLFFSWLVMPRELFARSVRDLMHWSSLCWLLRTYERSTCTKSSILFTDTKSDNENWTTPIYATCTSPIMHLIWPPKFCISIIFNFSWDGCNIQKKWKTAWTVLQNFGGQIRCIMEDVQVTNPAILTEQAWSIKYLFYGQIIVVLIHNGLPCCYLVFYE